MSAGVWGGRPANQEVTLTKSLRVSRHLAPGPALISLTWRLKSTLKIKGSTCNHFCWAGFGQSFRQTHLGVLRADATWPTSPRDHRHCRSSVPLSLFDFFWLFSPCCRCRFHCVCVCGSTYRSSRNRLRVHCHLLLVNCNLKRAALITLLSDSRQWALLPAVCYVKTMAARRWGTRQQQQQGQRGRSTHSYMVLLTTAACSLWLQNHRIQCRSNFTGHFTGVYRAVIISLDWVIIFNGLVIIDLVWGWCVFYFCILCECLMYSTQCNLTWSVSTFN